MGLVKGFSVKEGEDVIPVMQYADDMVVILEANETMVQNFEDNYPMV